MYILLFVSLPMLKLTSFIFIFMAGVLYFGYKWVFKLIQKQAFTFNHMYLPNGLTCINICNHVYLKKYGLTCI